MNIYTVEAYGSVHEVKADDAVISGDSKLALVRNVEGQTAQRVVAVFAQWNNFIVQEPA